MKRLALIAVLALAASLGLPTLGLAQATRSGIEHPVERPDDSGLLLLVPARDKETIDIELNMARELRNLANTRLDVAKSALEHSETRLDAAKAEIEHLEHQGKLAASEGKTEDQKRYEESRKRQELMYGLFEKHRELRKKDSEAARRLRELAEAKIQLCEDEHELLDLRKEQEKALSSESPNRKVKDLMARIHKLEKQMLEDYRKQLEAEERYVQKQKESFEQRMNVFKAQEKAIQEGL